MRYRWIYIMLVVLAVVSGCKTKKNIAQETNGVRKYGAFAAPTLSNPAGTTWHYGNKLSYFEVEKSDTNRVLVFISDEKWIILENNVFISEGTYTCKFTTDSVYVAFDYKQRPIYFSDTINICGHTHKINDMWRCEKEKNCQEGEYFDCVKDRRTRITLMKDDKQVVYLFYDVTLPNTDSRVDRYLQIDGTPNVWIKQY